MNPEKDQHKETHSETHYNQTVKHYKQRNSERQQGSSDLYPGDAQQD